MEVLKDIPKEVWGATIDIVNKLIFPITATTLGVGKLIEQKFNTLNEVQKIIAEQTLREATEKVKKSSERSFNNVVVKPQVLYTVLDSSDSQADEFTRSLWANLTARELSEGCVHPEIARTFAKLTAPDLVVLSELHSKGTSVAKVIIHALASTYTLGIARDPKSFHHVYLSELGLITEASGKWFVTTKGKELMKSISELEKDC
ncbi:hypothetical protein VCR3J2_320202 [Vibrio coralliirubri]|uniref:hypothetical protein n=1 Tax=Vibrio coralliirubri TaxID=1516159 RepID=UPI00063775A8|nr:hypothetical protein [Vibrio coralliirubri]CDT88446.1 hypothetical protein VCR3J2_320202 [Vibrio coralliirubri]